MSISSTNGRAASVAAPIGRFVAVEPSDVVDLPGGPTRGLFVGRAGALSIVGLDGVATTFHSNAGQYHPLRALRVNATETDAEDIVALY